MKIAWTSTDWKFSKVPGRSDVRLATYGGTYHYRMAVPAMELQYHGYECVLSWGFEPMTDGRIRIMDAHNQWHDDCDVIVFQRWMGRDGDDMALRARACGQIIINEVDDHYWAIPKASIAHKASDPKLSPEFNRDHYRKMLDASTAVFCSTPKIAALTGAKVPTFLCRNAIDIDRWTVRDPGSDGMIGWIGGIPWRGASDLRMLKESLKPFLEEYGLPFYHGGDVDDKGFDKAWEQIGLNPSVTQCAYNPLASTDDYPKLWEPVNLALVPLEDSLFNRCKSWLKGLEASACGIPFIASKLPEYEALGVGRLAKTPRQWRRHLEELLDPEVRRTEGAVNRLRAEELSIGNQWHHWDVAIKEACSSVPVAA